MKEKFSSHVVGLILISTIIRLFFSAFLEFGNDEVYYWTYALYPDWSHFDHPPMIGWMIQLFTGNLYFDGEWAIRLPSVILGAVNTWVLFLIGKRIKNELTGFFAAFLYTCSIYSFLLVGVFILPDTPMIFFMLLAFYTFLKVFMSESIGKSERQGMILAGVLTGLGMISKYNAVFVWVGAGLYILLFSRKWFKELSLYVSVIISLIILFPVIYWNDLNNWISFTFHGERVDIFESGLKLDYFFSELGGEILYNNPVYFILIICVFVALIRKKDLQLQGQSMRVILLMSLPIIGVFLLFSLFRRTLPHWNSPGYVILMPLVGAFLADKFRRNLKPILFPWPLKIASGLLVVILLLGALQIKMGVLGLDKQSNYYELGEDDVSLDMYGWTQIERQFAEYRLDAIAKGDMPKDAPIISYKWFPLANLDYYVARPLKMRTLAIGQLQDIHKYAWINRIRGGFSEGMDAWYITTSRNFKSPVDIYKPYFQEINIVDTIQIYRGGQIEKRAFVYELKDMKKIPIDVLKAL
ncbi:MAG: ArnT family glycosyltransferase [Bacteroidales bacterium]